MDFKKSASENIRLKKDKKKSGVDGLDILGKTTHHNIQCKAHSYFRAVPHPPTRKWPLIIELLLTLPITSDTLSTVMNTFCWGPLWLTGQCWSWPYGPLSTTCWFLPREWTRRQTGQSTPSSEHSVVMSVEGKTTLCLKQSFVDLATHTTFISLATGQLQCSTVLKTFQVGNLSLYSDLVSNTEIRHIFSNVGRFRQINLTIYLNPI